MTLSRPFRALGLHLAALLALAVFACSKNHQTPTAPSTPPVTPAPTAILKSLAINSGGPLTRPSQTSQFTATATFADGSTKDVSQTARWQSGDQTVATISPSGLVTALKIGETYVSAQYQSVYGGLRVYVLPDGTFSLSGKVTEPTDVVLSFASVQIVDPPSVGQTVTTNQYGFYKFYGVSGNLTLRVTKDGYADATKSIPVFDHQTLNIELRPVTPPASVAGAYRLTFTASPKCTLPDEAKTRSYSAQLEQAGAFVRVKLSGANFYNDPWSGTANSFLGILHADSMSFTLGYDDYYGIYSVAEQTAPTTYIIVSGFATVTATPSTIAGPLSGTMGTYASSIPGSFFSGLRPVTVCTAPDHQLTLTREGQTTSARRR